MLDELLLLSGNDIPFPQAQLIIHQPRLKEIAYITEQRFWFGCEVLKFNKENLTTQDKVDLSNMSNFNIIMMIIQEKNLQAHQARLNVLSILALLFPTKEILLGKKAIQLRDNQTGEVNEINENNFEIFKEIIINMFCLTNRENKQYNPSGQLARKIADKIKRGRQKKAELAPDSKMAILSRYISILAVGERKDINDLMNYTIYQLMDEFNRFELKMRYDSWQRFKAGGCTGMDDPEDWLKDIHNDNQSNDQDNDILYKI